MVKIIVGGVIGFCILVVAIIAFPVMQPLSQALFADSATVGWPTLLLMISRGWVYIVVTIIVGTAMFVIGRAMTGGGGFGGKI